MSKSINIVDTISAPGADPIDVQSIAAYRQDYALVDLPDNGLITKKILNEATALLRGGVTLTFPAGSAEWYELSDVELATINALQRYPIFQSFKENGSDRTLAFDSTFTCTGDSGFFTSITIKLAGTAGDGSGTSLDDTLIQLI